MRPEVICHMFSSIDGRIQTDSWSAPHGNKDLSEYLKVYVDIEKEYEADAVIFGLNTAKEFFQKRYSHMPGNRYRKELYKAPVKGSGFAVFCDPYGEIDYDASMFRGKDIILVLSHNISDEYKFYLERLGISYMIVGKNGFDIKKALEILAKEFEIEKVLLKGGGIINGAFLAKGLIDELSLCIYPGIDGLTGDKSLFDYIGSIESFKRSYSVELLTSEIKNHGVIWSRYKIHNH